MCVLHLIDRFHLKLNNTVHVLLFISILRILFFFHNKTHSLRKHKIYVKYLWYFKCTDNFACFFDSPYIIVFIWASFISNVINLHTAHLPIWTISSDTEWSDEHISSAHCAGWRMWGERGRVRRKTGARGMGGKLGRWPRGNAASRFHSKRFEHHLHCVSICSVFISDSILSRTGRTNYKFICLNSIYAKTSFVLVKNKFWVHRCFSQSFIWVLVE